MGHPRPRRGGDSLRRKLPSREPKPRLLVVCEGKVTEPEYFTQLRRLAQARLVEIKIVAPAGTPKSVVERAKIENEAAVLEATAARDEFLLYDDVWCVLDVDDHPRIREALVQAQANGFHVAKSNPCFELWLLLHYQNQTAHIERAALSSLLRNHIRGYDKHVSVDILIPRYKDAVKRASALERRHEAAAAPGGNPSTGVHRLTERIFDAGRRPH